MRAGREDAVGKGLTCAPCAFFDLICVVKMMKMPGLVMGIFPVRQTTCYDWMRERRAVWARASSTRLRDQRYWAASGHELGFFVWTDVQARSGLSMGPACPRPRGQAEIERSWRRRSAEVIVCAASWGNVRYEEHVARGRGITAAR